MGSVCPCVQMLVFALPVYACQTERELAFMSEVALLFTDSLTEILRSDFLCLFMDVCGFHSVVKEDKC